jgi:hypothetical protein
VAGNIAAIADPQDSATHVEGRNRLAIDLDIVVIFSKVGCSLALLPIQKR